MPTEHTPLIVALHGAFKTAAKFEKETGLSRLADRDGIVVAYPDGIGILGLLQHWNAGFCCGKAARDGIDDIGFISRVIEDTRARLSIDPRRVYLVGFSNGGMLAYRFGAERPRQVAAIAVLGAAIGARSGPDAPYERIPTPGDAVPLIVFHGRDDPLIPYDGGRAIRRNSPREYLSVADAARFWAGNNRCGASPAIARLARGSITEETWACPEPRSDVVVYTLDGWGHRWPGGETTLKLGADSSLKGFDAAEIILDFFRRHPDTD